MPKHTTQVVKEPPFFGGFICLYLLLLFTTKNRRSTHEFISQCAAPVFVVRPLGALVRTDFRFLLEDGI